LRGYFGERGHPGAREGADFRDVDRADALELHGLLEPEAWHLSADPLHRGVDVPFDGSVIGGAVDQAVDGVPRRRGRAEQ